MKRWKCVICGFVYDQAQGLPAEGIAPGTSWDEVPESWTCPDCGASKSDFAMEELDEAA
jgi:rubredoxin